MSISLEEARRLVDGPLQEKLEEHRREGAPEPTSRPSLDEARRMLQEADMGAGVNPGLTPDVLAAATNQKELGPPLENFAIRALMGSADTDQERLLALRKFHPDGELYRITGREQEKKQRFVPAAGFGLNVPPTEVTTKHKPETLMWRPDKTSSFGLVDDPALTWSDLADFSDDTFSLLMEAFIFKGKGGAFKKAAQSFGLTTAGDTVQQSLEAVGGINEESLDDVATRIGIKGFASAGGALGADALLKLAGRGEVLAAKNVASTTPEGQQAIKASQDIGLEDEAALMAQQVSGNPILRVLAAQSEQVSESIRNHRIAQQRFLTGELDALALKEETDQFMARMTEASRQMRETYLGEMQRFARAPVDFEDAGRAIKEGFDEFKDRHGTALNQAYRAARSSSEPTFDMLQPINESGQHFYDALSEAASDLQVSLGGAGMPQEASKTLKFLSEMAKKIDPDLSGPTTVNFPTAAGVIEHKYMPVELLRGYRSALFDLKTPPVGEKAKQWHRAASRAYDAMNQVLDNPITGNTKLYKEANAMARGHFQTLEDGVILDLARESAPGGRPADLAERVIKPNNFRSLNNLRAVVSDTKFDQIGNAFKTQLMTDARGGKDITKRLAEFEPRTLDLLLTKTEQKAYMKWGQELIDFNSSSVQTGLRSQSRHRKYFETIVSAQSTKDVDKFVNLYNSADKLTKNSMKAAMYDWAVNRMVVVGDKGIRTIDSNSVKATMDELKDLGFSRLFSVDERATLQAMEMLAPFVKTMGSDAGAALAAAQSVGGVRGLLNPLNPDVTGAISALHNVMEMGMLGRMLTNKKFRNWITGHGSRQFKDVTKNSVRFIVAGLASANADLKNESLRIDSDDDFDPAGR